MVHEQMAVSARGIARGNAVTADPPGVMAIHYNPAGLSRLPGKQVTVGVTVLPVVEKRGRFSDDPEDPGLMDGDVDPLDGTEGSTSGWHPGRGELPAMAAPTLGFSTQAPDSRWTYALGSYVPFGLGFEHRDPDDPSRYGAREVYNWHLIYAAPAVSYQVTKSLSVGVAMGLGRSAMGASVSVRMPNEMVALTHVLGEATEGLEIPVISELTLPQPWFGGGLSTYGKIGELDLDVVDNFVPTYNVGLLWSPAAWLSFGAVYQSEGKSTMGGDYCIEYGEEFQRFAGWWGSSPMTLSLAGILNMPMQAVEKQQGRVVTEWTNPQRVQLGVALRPLRGLTLTADFHYANWAVVESNVFVFDQTIQLLQVANIMGYQGAPNELVIERHWRDTTHWSFGLEYWFFDLLALRLGYEERPSPVPDEYFDLSMPLAGVKAYSGGIGVHLNAHLQCDFAFTYIVQPETYRVPNNTSQNLNSTEFTDVIYSPYAGLDYEQDVEAYSLSLELTYRW